MCISNNFTVDADTAGPGIDLCLYNLPHAPCSFHQHIMLALPFKYVLISTTSFHFQLQPQSAPAWTVE